MTPLFAEEVAKNYSPCENAVTAFLEDTPC